MTDYTSSIIAAAQQYGVDPALALSVAQTESSMNPNAVSPKGAIGLFQLMPSTAAGLGVNPSDPLQNIDGGVHYLAQLLQQFGGNVSLALAAYNAGPTTVAQYQGIPPFTETQNYVSSVLSKIGAWMGIVNAGAPQDQSAGDGTASDGGTADGGAPEAPIALSTMAIAAAVLAGLGLVLFAQD